MAYFCDRCGGPMDAPCEHFAPKDLESKTQKGDGWTELKPGCKFCGKEIDPPTNYVEAECGCRCCSEEHATAHAKICGHDERDLDNYELDHRNG